MTLPIMSEQARIQGLEKAGIVRRERAELKNKLKAGTVTLADAIADSGAAGIKVLALLQALPGIGKVGAKQLMDRLGIAENRRVQGLGKIQRAALLAEFPAAA